MNAQGAVLVWATSSTELQLPPLIGEPGIGARGASRILHRLYSQPQHAGCVCAGVKGRCAKRLTLADATG